MRIQCDYHNVIIVYTILISISSITMMVYWSRYPDGTTLGGSLDPLFVARLAENGASTSVGDCRGRPLPPSLHQQPRNV